LAGPKPFALLTQVEFDEADFPKAQEVAKRLGYEQTAYTSTSALWGLFCLPENPRTAKRGQQTRGGCIIKTRELGMMFVQNLEDLHMEDIATWKTWRATVRAFDTDSGRQIGDTWTETASAATRHEAQEKIRNQAWEEIDVRLNDVRVDIVDIEELNEAQA
jgi:hypothetical protein